MSNENKFLFLGNGSYNNHGCEAIVRGTMEILKQSFGDAVSVANGIAERPPVVDHQERTAAIDGVTSFSILDAPSLFSRFRNKLAKSLSTSGEIITARNQITPHLREACAMLALGGDNFSLEYGVPYNFLGWNALARDAGLPSFIWGASIGPFSRAPAFEKQFIRHARTLTRLFVRESETLAYLTRLGLEEKLYLAADPAFAMNPTKPSVEAEGLEHAIGISLSPLMAEFVTAGNKTAWKDITVEILLAIAKASERPLVLIPHVNASSATRSCDPGWYYKDDYGFLSEVSRDRRLNGISIQLLSNELSAPELKYEISRLWAFAGARTHATIAAFSTGVPCISLAYSVKAMGLNRDIFGSTDFCLPPSSLSPERLVSAFSELEKSRAAILLRYKDVIPKLKQSALSAGTVLKSDIASLNELR